MSGGPMALRLLSAKAMEDLYVVRLCRDFPESEIKPLTEILRLMRTGSYEALAAIQDHRIVGYALIFLPTRASFGLIDYLAVEPDCRGTGLGHEILRRLQSRYAGRAEGLFIECETPSALPDPLDSETARRRIDFYLGAGACMTRSRVELYEVDFSILLLPCRKADEADPGYTEDGPSTEDLIGMYHEMMLPEIIHDHLRIIA